MGNTSKMLTVLPVIFGLLFVGVDFVFGDTFTIEQTHVQLIEFLIGSTVLGGTANAGYKRFVNYKTEVSKSG